MKAVTVFCGASSGNKPSYAEAARHMARELVSRNIRIIFGGGKIGMMGVAADAAIASGGEVIGVIPTFLKTKEVAHDHLHEMHVVKTMHERKALMHELSDGIIAMPGGYGTLDELFEIMTWAQLGLHDYPVGLLNTNGYFNHLIALLDHMVAEGFLSPENRSMMIVHDDPVTLLHLMENYIAPPVPHWLSKDQV
ncbi:MAG: TIGR00730 family Rossman fold protein [Flavobacteriales bacterium]|nr:TIGR00730 family Rossman fold protein [Flavobacteriales bacterium]